MIYNKLGFNGDMSSKRIFAKCHQFIYAFKMSVKIHNGIEEIRKQIN